MYEQKTKPSQDSVEGFLNAVEDEKKRRDSFTLLALIKEASGEQPVLWGNMVGFGSYHYRYASGHEGDAFLTGFSPRKQNLTIYIMPGFEQYQDLMERLGKYKTGKSCLYIKKVEDINLDVLKELVHRSVERMRQEYPQS
jgi:hypothetical protein